MSIYLPYPIDALPPGGGFFVAFGDLGRIATSPDGFDWTLVPTSFTINLFTGFQANGNYLAAGRLSSDNPRIVASYGNPQSWNGLAPLSPLLANFIIPYPSFALGNYCLANTAGSFYKSADAISFANQSTGIGSSTQIAANYGDDDILIFGYSFRSIIFSSDLSLFTTGNVLPFSTSSGSGLNGLFKAGPYYFATARNTSGSTRNVLARSPDAITWTAARASANTISGFATGNGNCVVFDDGAWILRSNDYFVSNLTQPTVPPGGPGIVWCCASDNADTFIVAGENIMVSIDGGLTWQFSNNNPFGGGIDPGTAFIRKIIYVPATT